MSPQRPLTRSSNNVMVAGVCAGVAEWIGWDPTLVRILWVLATFFSAAFPGVVVYIILWVVMPVG
jgi:phage shock protein PspC (stress-responsive transcriptional regulator)